MLSSGRKREYPAHDIRREIYGFSHNNTPYGIDNEFAAIEIEYVKRYLIVSGLRGSTYFTLQYWS